MSFSAVFDGNLSQDAGEKLCTDLVAVTPRENVVKLTGGASVCAMGSLLIATPNIVDLYLIQSVVTDTFLRLGPFSHTKLLPSLRHLCLDYFALPNNDDWSPLKVYLIHWQTSSGQTISLRLCGKHAPIPPNVVEEIEGLVDELNLGYSD